MMPSYDYQCETCGVIEIFHGMKEKNKTKCPTCKGSLQKMICNVGGIIIGNREANQYSDIKKAKYWRDKNGVKHRVTGADGHTGSGTVTKQTATPAEIKAHKKKDAKDAKARRMDWQLKADTQRIKKQLKKK